MSVTSTIFLSILLVHHSCRSEPLAGLADPAEPFEFRFVVSIARKFDITHDNPYGHVCGGALISRKYVLTAASCFDVNRHESNYFVYIGSRDLSRSRKIEIEKLTTYYMWYTRSKLLHTWIFDENDIAVVRLSEQIMKPTRPIKMWNVSPTSLVGKEVITAGWGTMFVAPQHMLKAKLRVINNSQCMQNVRIVANDPTYVLQKNLFCTNVPNFFATLDEGDKGSPVFVKHPCGDYRLVGVNQKAVPAVNNVVQIADQQNKHISIHYYYDYINLVSRVYPIED